MLLRSRQFIQTNYSTIKQHNPDLPILIREAKDTPARAFARYGTFLSLILSCSYSCGVVVCVELGVEKHVELDGLSSKDVESKISTLFA